MKSDSVVYIVQAEGWETPAEMDSEELANFLKGNQIFGTTLMNFLEQPLIDGYYEYHGITVKFAGQALNTEEALRFYIKCVIGATEVLGDTIGQLNALLYEHAGDSEEVEKLVTVSRQVIDAMVDKGESLLCDIH